MKWIISTVLVWTLASALQAKEADLRQALTIKADIQEFTQDNQMVYRGNVKLQQGTLSLSSDTLTVVLNDKQQTERFLADGKPVHYRQQSQSGDWIDAEASSVDFNVRSRLLTLTRATLKQAKHQITSDRIEYDTANNRFTATNATTIRYPDANAEVVPAPTSTPAVPELSEPHKN